MTSPCTRRGDGPPPQPFKINICGMESNLKFIETWEVAQFKAQQGVEKLEVKQNPHTGKVFFVYGLETGPCSRKVETGQLHLFQSLEHDTCHSRFPVQIQIPAYLPQRREIQCYKRCCQCHGSPHGLQARTKNLADRITGNVQISPDTCQLVERHPPQAIRRIYIQFSTNLFQIIQPGQFISRKQTINRHVISHTLQRN